MICRINLDRFKNFMSSLSVIEENEPQTGGYDLYYITYSFNYNNNFVGGNGIWNEIMNAMFKSEIPAPKKKNEVEDFIEMGDSYNG